MVNADQNNFENGHFSRRSQFMELRPNKKEPKWRIKNVSIIISCFHVQFEVELFLICNGEALRAVEMHQMHENIFEI